MTECSVSFRANWSSIGTDFSHLAQHFSGKLLIFPLILGENPKLEPKDYKLAQSDFCLIAGRDGIASAGAVPVKC